MKDEDKVKIEKVRENGVILYDVYSILNSAPAKRHLQFLRNQQNKRKKQFKKPKKSK